MVMVGRTGSNHVLHDSAAALQHCSTAPPPFELCVSQQIFGISSCTTSAFVPAAASVNFHIVHHTTALVQLQRPVVAATKAIETEKKTKLTKQWQRWQWLWQWLTQRHSEKALMRRHHQGISRRVSSPALSGNCLRRHPCICLVLSPWFGFCLCLCRLGLRCCCLRRRRGLWLRRPRSLWLRRCLGLWRCRSLWLRSHLSCSLGLGHRFRRPTPAGRTLAFRPLCRRLAGHLGFRFGRSQSSPQSVKRRPLFPSSSGANGNRSQTLLSVHLFQWHWRPRSHCLYNTWGWIEEMTMAETKKNGFGLV